MTDRLAQNAWLILSVLCSALPCPAVPCPAVLPFDFTYTKLWPLLELCQHIQFTAEKLCDYAEDNSNIPILDFRIGISENNDEYILKFYEKTHGLNILHPCS